MMPQTVLNVPFAIMSIQSDVPSKEENEVTRGSQMTKLATLDFMAAGVPIDFRPDIESFTERYNLWFALDENGKLGYNDGDNLYKEIKNNQDILEALVEEGVYALTSEFGLTKVDEGYKIESFDKVAEAIRREVTKREVNDNISAALAQSGVRCDCHSAMLHSQRVRHDNTSCSWTPRPRPGGSACRTRRTCTASASDPR